MNKDTKEMFKQFVYLVLDDEHGISKEAYEMLTHMMVYDRDMASAFHEVVEMASENSEGRFQINP